ncbi:MAG: hypothetical protein A2Y76_05715 [Planctomycetes bacterium RBG_13_60_9]|nr:MAG: hypothetical protein A2Y76_05715 [Planctomycetes bacterium RBG_13_60_9]
MMTRVANLAWVGVSTLVLMAGCTSTEERLQLRKPTAQVVGVGLRDVSAYGATLVFEVEVQNHYAFDVPLLSFNYSLSSAGQGFMAGSSELRITVPAGGSRTVSLPARVDYIKALQELSNVRPGAKIPYEAELNLVVNTPRLGSITLPLRRAGELLLPEVPASNLKAP